MNPLKGSGWYTYCLEHLFTSEQNVEPCGYKTSTRLSFCDLCIILLTLTFDLCEKEILIKYIFSLQYRDMGVLLSKYEH